MQTAMWDLNQINSRCCLFTVLAKVVVIGTYYWSLVRIQATHGRRGLRSLTHPCSNCEITTFAR